MASLTQTSVKSNGTAFNDVILLQNSDGIENAKLCRAWVNFSGGGTPTVRVSFNVSSITDNGNGAYTVNFSNAMSGGNLVVNVSAKRQNVSEPLIASSISTLSNSCSVLMGTVISVIFSPLDADIVNVSIFR